MIKLFTHNDLDGLSCAILACLAYGMDNVSYETCKYEDINEKVTAYIETKDYLNYERCFITDISLSDELAQHIHTLNPRELTDGVTLTKHFKLLDHHITASHLNEFNWCHVEDTDQEGVKCSGTSLFFNFLRSCQVNSPELLAKPLVAQYTEKVRRYDTWDWAKHEDLEAKRLNDLLYILGKERFLTYWIDRLQNDQGDFGFDATQLLLLELRQNEIDKYIESREEEIITKNILGYKAGIVFADRFQSELGNKLSELHPELDFIAMINVNGGVSCRTSKENVNLGADIAKVFGGGGHAKAAGLPVADEIRELVINGIFGLA